MKRNESSLRLFIALEIPSDLEKAIRRYEKEIPYWRFCKDLHLTVRFIGETPAAKLGPLLNSFENGLKEPRKVRFTSAGYGFNPSEKRAGSMCLRMQCSHAMQELKDKIDDIVLNSLGLPKETRSFQPHVTLMRFQKPLNFLDLTRLKKWGDAFPKLPEPFASKIILFKSELTPDGALHTALSEQELDYL